jgi:hypothetical protein
MGWEACVSYSISTFYYHTDQQGIVCANHGSLKGHHGNLNLFSGVTGQKLEMTCFFFFLCSAAVYLGTWLFSADEITTIVDVEMNGYFLSCAEWFGERLGERYHMVTVLCLLLRVLTYLLLFVSCYLVEASCRLPG